jgi:hypothetical protein
MGPFDGRTRLDLLVAQKPLVIYYDPSRPARSVLIQGSGPLEIAAAIVSLIFASIFAFLAFA